MMSIRGNQQQAMKPAESEDEGEGAVERTSRGLRDALFDEIDLIRRGDGDPLRAGAVAKLAAQIIATVKMDLTYRATIVESPNLALDAGEPLKLGREK